MFGKKKRAPPPPRGQGAAAAMQFGLFEDMDPEKMMMDMQEENLDDTALEAELAAITGNKAAPRGRAKPKGKSPLPMEDITRMADECMRDMDDSVEDDDDDVEGDEDLLAELQEVVGEDADVAAISPTSSSDVEVCKDVSPEPPPTQQEVKVSSAPPGSLQHTLEERINMYKTALQNAKSAGESSKARRFDRGLKTLESMLSALKKGRSVNEAEIPPPVATGESKAVPQPSVPARPASPAPSPPESPLLEQHEESVATAPPAAPPRRPPPAVPKIVTPTSEEEAPSPEEQTEEPALPGPTDAIESTKTALVERQTEYKMAALRAKKQGDLEQAKHFFRIGKSFDPVIEALEKGQAVDLSRLPPPPGEAAGGSTTPVKETSSTQNAEVTQPAAAAVAPARATSSVPAAPKDVLEALEQRLAKYAETAAEAKASGNDRKSRMYDRIKKQYQAAIRSHKAGKAVNFDELPDPPGFPPIPGQKAVGAEQGLVTALEAANKLVSTDATEAADKDDDEEKEAESKPAVPEKPKKATLDVSTSGDSRKRSPSPSPDRSATRRKLSATAIQQLEFLEGRKKQYLKAALQAKQKNDLEKAKTLLRTAKGLDPMIEVARQGKSVDISTVPSPPGDDEDEEDFILVHQSDVQLSEKAEQVYTQLAKILKEQHEKCMTYSKQFTHLGNISETTKFEKMAEGCKKSVEVLKLAQSRGLPPPKHHFEEKSFHIVRIFPELSSTDMVVEIVKGMNLPAPSGIQTNDLDAFIKFDFPYPSNDQPQRHKTTVIKNTNSPEYNQSFTLSINRNHRGFRRVVTSKGLKLELLHKGGFFRSDKPIGTASVKLDKLESQSEIREIVEVMDGRKPTGGRVEVKVRLREPLSGQDKQTSTERWLVIDHSQVLY